MASLLLRLSFVFDLNWDAGALGGGTEYVLEIVESTISFFHNDLSLVNVLLTFLQGICVSHWAEISGFSVNTVVVEAVLIRIYSSYHYFFLALISW